MILFLRFGAQGVLFVDQRHKGYPFLLLPFGVEVFAVLTSNILVPDDTSEERHIAFCVLLPLG